MVTETQRETYRTRGYFFAEDAMEPDMLGLLLEAVRRVKAKVRSGQVDIYTHWADPGEPGRFADFLRPRCPSRSLRTI